MLSFVYDQDEAVCDFVAERSNMPRGCWPNSKAIGIVDERNDFLAGVVYHHWSPEAGTIVISGASKTSRWLTRSVLQRIFDYPFVECGCQMVIMQISTRDLRLQRQLAVIGFAFVKIGRLYGRGQDGIIATMTVEDWQECKFNSNVVELEEAA